MSLIRVCVRVCVCLAAVMLIFTEGTAPFFFLTGNLASKQGLAAKHLHFYHVSTGGHPHWI